MNDKLFTGIYRNALIVTDVHVVDGKIVSVDVPTRYDYTVFGEEGRVRAECVPTWEKVKAA